MVLMRFSCSIFILLLISNGPAVSAELDSISAASELSLYDKLEKIKKNSNAQKLMSITKLMDILPVQKRINLRAGCFTNKTDFEASNKLVKKYDDIIGDGAGVSQSKGCLGAIESTAVTPVETSDETGTLYSNPGNRYFYAVKENGYEGAPDAYRTLLSNIVIAAGTKGQYTYTSGAGNKTLDLLPETVFDAGYSLGYSKGDTLADGISKKTKADIFNGADSVMDAEKAREFAEDIYNNNGIYANNTPGETAIKIPVGNGTFNVSEEMAALFAGIQMGEEDRAKHDSLPPRAPVSVTK